MNMPSNQPIDIRNVQALTDWWEGAGVSVDQKHLDRLIQSARTQIAERGELPLAPHIRTSSSAVDAAKAAAKAASTLDELRAAVEAFEGCELKAGATKTVFADGAPQAEIMVIGEGPGREEDQIGQPFVGQTGHLLDKMLAAIGLSRQDNTYITNVNFWRPPGNRNPTDEELEICRPFVDKHIALVQPQLIIATGAVPAKALLGLSDGIIKLRGKQMPLQIADLKEPIPVFPIFHPAYLLRRPLEKARAWHDLLLISAYMEEIGIGASSAS